MITENSGSCTNCSLLVVEPIRGQSRHKTLLAAFAVACCMIPQTGIVAQDFTPYFAAHNQGNIQLTVSPGEWGLIPYRLFGHLMESFPCFDPITGDSIDGCIYPRGSGNFYIDGFLSAGGVAGGDTLFTWFWEHSYALAFDGSFWRIMSSDPTSPHHSLKARSALDLECRFADTARLPDYDIWDLWDYERSEPTGLGVVQRSMAWSGASVDDFVMIEYEITNLGRQGLENVYFGFWCDAYRGGTMAPPRVPDHLTGFLQAFPSSDGCEHIDTLNVAYNMDNDGDPVGNDFTSRSRRGAVGIMLLGSPGNSIDIGYAWWVWDAACSEDWGPRRRPTEAEPWRSFNPFFAWPGSDRNLYYVMSHPYVAYDQLFAAVSHYGWMPPWHLGEAIASGWTSAFVYSFGPFNIGVKEHVSFTVAVVGGDNVHTNPGAIFDPYNPQSYYDQLDFSELAENARWAQWVYDNPGVDTDSDGYAGEFRVCEGDTTWYKGDGVPDFRGNSPPPIPFTRYETEPGRIIVRWNGFLSETTKDIFSGLIDFEGYRVYCGLDNRRTSLSLLTTYDKENWFRWKYHELGTGQGRWVNDDPPYSLDSLRIIHDDPDFDPARYPRERPLIEGDSAFYFQPVDGNRADLSSITGIHKAYPEATNPGTDSLLWTEEDITTEHGRSLPKYYEYEYIIENLLPTVPYFVSVTVFDFGYAGGRGNMPPDETNPLSNLTEVYAQTSSEIVEQQDLDVYVYPNPYRADADYYEHGYENRKGTIIPDRARLIHFSNLPRVCRISIFSLDGDLIGTIKHNFPEGGPESMHDWWNLVSRSGLAVESGLYYWVVESPARTQIGKLVILK
jgi:hypothetical protein